MVRHLLLALAVVAVRGTNFVGVKVALAKLPPLVVLALLVEGPAAIGHAFFNADTAAWARCCGRRLGNTHFGFAAWGWLLTRHPTATISPMALLVPAFGMAAAARGAGYLSLAAGSPHNTFRRASRPQLVR